MIDVVSDVLHILDRDEMTIQAKIASLQGEILALQQQLENSRRFRQLAADIQSGAAFSSVVVPGAPTPTGTPEPITTGITIN